jgi:hypothetical protein
VRTKTSEELKHIDVRKVANLRCIDDIEIGEATRKGLTKLKKELHKVILLDMRNFLASSVEYLQKTLPLSNTVLIHRQCLNPDAHAGLQAHVRCGGMMKETTILFHI